MSIHLLLTEPSLSPHPRKGREGKGTGKGREAGWVTSHHFVQQGDARGPRIGMMPLRAVEVTA